MGGRQKTTLFTGTSTIGEEVKKAQEKSKESRGKSGKRKKK